MHRFDYRRTLIVGFGFLGISIPIARSVLAIAAFILITTVFMALAFGAMQPVRAIRPQVAEAAT
jgi:hypothetical protein